MRYTVFLVFVFLCACSKVDHAEALDFGTCKAVVLNLAKNPSSAKIPRIKPINEGPGRVQYSWGRGSGLTMQNGYGAMIDTRVGCVLKDGGLHILSVDGKGITGQQFDLLRLTAASYRASNQK